MRWWNQRRGCLLRGRACLTVGRSTDRIAGLRAGGRRALDHRTADDDRSTWVNIHEDEAAAEYVRSVNDGNELTPTVVIGDEVYRNPDADEVRAALG